MTDYDQIKKHRNKKKERASSQQRLTTLIEELFFFLKWPGERWGSFEPIHEKMGGQSCTVWYKVDDDGPQETLEVHYEPTPNKDVWNVKWTAHGGNTGEAQINEADPDDESRIAFCEACGKHIQ